MLDPNANGTLLAILPFTSFLLRYLPIIDPNEIVIAFDKRTSDQANQLGLELRYYSLRFVKVDVRHSKHYNRPNFRRDLVLSLLEPNKSNLYITSRAISIYVIDEDIHQLGALEPAFTAIKCSHHISCFSWTLRKRFKQRTLKDELMNEADWLKSLDWTMFLRTHRKLPPKSRLTFLDNVETHRMRTFDRNTICVSGFRVGIYKIVSEQLTGNSMSYVEDKPLFGHFKYRKNIKSLHDIRFMDKRLIAKVSTVQTIHRMSLVPQFALKMPFFGATGLTSRYIVAAPRIIDNYGSNQLALILIQCQVILTFLLTTAGFVTLRYFSRLINGKRPPGGAAVVHMFFDTFSRALSNSTEKLSVKVVSERLVLTAVSIFAIISGSIFSGILYENQISEDYVIFSVNSLNDICEAKMQLLIPSEITTKENLHMYRFNQRYMLKHE